MRHCAGYSWQLLFLPLHNFSPSLNFHAEKEEGGGGEREEKMRAGKVGRGKAGDGRRALRTVLRTIRSLTKSQSRLQSSVQSYPTRSELSLFHDPTSQRKRKRWKRKSLWQAEKPVCWWRWGLWGARLWNMQYGDVTRIRSLTAIWEGSFPGSGGRRLSTWGILSTEMP